MPPQQQTSADAQWQAAEPIRISLLSSGVALVVLGCCVSLRLRAPPMTAHVVSVIGTWAYVSAALAIAAGAVLVDSFRDADRMRGKLAGRMGCGGDAAGGGDFCCAPTHGFGLLVACIVFAVLAVLYGVGACISGASTLQYIGPNCVGGGYYYNYYNCAAWRSGLTYVAVTGALTAALSIATIVPAAVALSRLQQLRGRVAGGGQLLGGACCGPQQLGRLTAPPPPPMMVYAVAGGYPQHPLVAGPGGAAAAYPPPVGIYAQYPQQQLQPLQPPADAAWRTAGGGGGGQAYAPYAYAGSSAVATQPFGYPPFAGQAKSAEQVPR